MRILRLTCLALIFTLVTAPIWAAPAALYRISDTSPGFDKSTAAVAGVVEEVEIVIDTGALDLAPETLELFLPDGRRLTATKSRFVVGASSLNWSGKIDNSGDLHSYVHLFDRGDRISGVVNLGAERFQIVATEFGHRLVRIELQDKVCFLEGQATSHDSGLADKSWSRDADPAHSTAAGSSFAKTEAAGSVTQPAGLNKAIATIDVLAIYPNAFSGAAENNAIDFIEDSISMANDVFIASNIDARYRLLDSVKLTGSDQPPATGLVGALDWMTHQQVGNQDVNDIGPQEMLDLRNEYAADVVALFVPLSYDADTACGIANLPEADGDIRQYSNPKGDFGERAYTAHRVDCGLNDFTFAHEIGHNFGMRHSVFENTSASQHLFPNGRGHVLSATPWQSGANGTLQTDVSGNFTVGYHFTPAVDGYVVGLGGLFNGTKNVYLWQDGVTNVLHTEQVTSSNNWTYEELIFPVAVQAGTRYTVATHTVTGGSIYSNVANFPQSYGQITIHGSTVIAGNFRPTTTVTDVMYGQVDILFTPTNDLETTIMGCARLDEGEGDITDEVCNHIEYFSDPNLQVSGRATGTSSRNNSAVARNRAPIYAGFQTNNAPICQTDTFSTPTNTNLSITLGGLLNNDSDPNGDPLFLADYDLVTAQGGSNDTGHAGGFNYTPPSGFSGTDWFSYTISDRPAGHPAGQSDTCVVQINVIGNEEVFGEVGSVANLTGSSQLVLLSRSYSNPVVIAQTVSQNGADTSVVRITNVQSDRFSMYVDEAPNFDGSHVGETVGYLVVEAGTWQLPNGSQLRAGTLQTSSTVGRLVTNQWQSLGFGGAFASTPRLFSQVQTNNDPSWVKTRHFSVGTSSAQLALEKDEASNVSHGLETVGWLAITSGSGTSNGRSYIVGQTPNAVTGAFYTLSFGKSVNSPRLFAALRTYDGPDNAGLRYNALTSSSVQVRAEEDTTLDTETNHTTEIVDYLVIGGSGQLTGTQQ